MKAKELAEELLKNPDFEVEFNHFGDVIIGESIMPELITFTNVEVNDIGYSDKVIKLGGDKK